VGVKGIPLKEQEKLEVPALTSAGTVYTVWTVMFSFFTGTVGDTDKSTTVKTELGSQLETWTEFCAVAYTAIIDRRRVSIFYLYIINLPLVLCAENGLKID
jgi:hypothetical protein